VDTLYDRLASFEVKELGLADFSFISDRKLLLNHSILAFQVQSFLLHLTNLQV
jgi:hypothetical protein